MSASSRNNPLLEAVRAIKPGASYRTIYEAMTGTIVTFKGIETLDAVWDSVFRNDEFEAWREQATSVVWRLHVLSHEPPLLQPWGWSR